MLLAQIPLHGNAYSAVSDHDHNSSFNRLEKQWQPKPLSSGLFKPKSVPVRKKCVKISDNLVSAQADAGQEPSFLFFPETH